MPSGTRSGGREEGLGFARSGGGTDPVPLQEGGQQLPSPESDTERRNEDVEGGIILGTERSVDACYEEMKP